MRDLIRGVAVLAAALPASFVLTFLLSPLWSWVERDLGIESMGHSGPAQWCFWATYLVLSVAGMLVAFRGRGEPAAGGGERP